MIRLDAGARFTLIGDAGESVLDLNAAGPRVTACRDWLRRRVPAGSRVGLVFRTSPELVVTWLAAMAAGLEPCVLHYPTSKLSRRYWIDSIADTIGRCGLDALVVAAEVEQTASDLGAACHALPASLPSGDGTVSEVGGSFLQLSSGTTGARKPIRYDLHTALEHVRRYNTRLSLDGTDCVVSWLPLYHDMGFVACFLLPMALGLRAVLIDPMTWTKTPGMLFDAIETHEGTACWMPNFGFEVMSRQPPRHLGTMRHWISCSEPSRIDTLGKFSVVTGTRHEQISTCYAMAENVFAVSQSDGLSSRVIDGWELVSCGLLLPETDVKIVDEELFVRSPSSLREYADGTTVVDSDGFYGTGDLGKLLDGELFVFGRKHDVLNTAGQKWLLSDLDHQLNRVSACAGRGATLADTDPGLPGTDVPTFLIERPDFWDATAAPSLQRALHETTGLSHLSVHFVPPSFITKTSSGKVNRRRTLADWRAVTRPAGRDGELTPEDLSDEVTALFPDLAAEVPLGEALDSLGTVAMQLLVEKHGCQWDPQLSLADLLSSRAPVAGSQPHPNRGLSLVVLADWDNLGWIDDAFAHEMAEAAGLPVQVDHVCAPPSFALLNDLIFHDYFMPRDQSRDYRAVSRCLQRIKQASLLVVDDMSELWFPSFDLSYPTLSHRFERDEDANRMGLRWTPYIANHHNLPIQVVDHHQFPAQRRNEDLARLGAYLGIPVFRRATSARFAEVTVNWESRSLRPDADVLAAIGDDGPSLRRDLLNYLAGHANALRPSATAIETGVLRLGDRNHFCSNLVSQAAIDFLIAQPYASYVISGVPASVPALARELKRAGKQVRYTRTLRVGSDPVDCVVQTGTWGVPETSAPVYELMNADRNRGVPLNVAPELAALWPGWREAREAA